MDISIVPGGLSTLGALLLALSLMAALILNCTDQRRKLKKGTSVSKSKTNKASSSEVPKQHCSILFGTQTGTAEKFAKSLKSQLESKFGAHTAFDVIDLEHYSAEEQLPKERLVFFLMATYGDGEPTDNAADFFNWLVKSAESASLDDLPCKDVSYGVFGLGNRQYEHFCAVGKRIHRAMEDLGALPIVRLGTGDDDADIDQDFDAWCEDLFAALDASPLLEAGQGADITADSVPAYDVQMVMDAPADAVDVLKDGPGTSLTASHLATITALRELHTPLSDRSCVHVEIDISKSSVTYEAGDHIAIFAENSDAIVTAVANTLGVPLSTCFRLKVPAGNPQGLPEPPNAGPITLRAALKRYADVLSSPSKGGLAALAAFAEDASEAARLRELASIEGRDAYHAYISAAKRSLLEVLQDFPSARPTLGAFFGSIAPRLQPRFYSISSSPALHPRSAHVTAAIVKETMPSGRVHEGVATTWLAKATPGTKVPIFIRRSTFKLPADFSVPVVMVGPGTGVAPFRGFIQERAAAAARGRQLGPGILFFGCRRRDQDYIYQEELEGAVTAGALSALNLAFSREGTLKDYVQHHMARQAQELWALLGPEGNGYLYVCGDAKNMAKDVHSTLVEIATKAGNGSADAEVRRLADSGRYLKDVW